MNKTIIGFVIGVVILVGLAALYFKGNLSGNQPATSEQATTAPVGEAPAASQTSLKDLIALGQSQKCTFSDNTSGTMQGNVYVGSGKMRGDFTSTSSGQTFATHMIVDEKNSYVWIDGQPTGFKTSLAASQAPTPDTAANQFDIDKKVNYQCSSWLVDTALFTLPGSVQFTDVSAFSVPGQQPAATNSSLNADKAAQCATCDSVPAASRNQCRLALGCS